MKTLIQAAAVGTLVFSSSAFAIFEPNEQSTEALLMAGHHHAIADSSAAFTGIYDNALVGTERHLTDGINAAQSDYCVVQGLSVALEEHPTQGHFAGKQC
ncbi:hypothetical protein [Neptunomonas marina]|uniref:DUF732 domain-containing protein n=1 Tax=Neptunomonas marina TaxID=1815562 RepID=A0A437Q613_9GAMM|nr:hypothetical protein [Neptunomonas marina]RVU29932.1 hypothetical protein EOE65_12760 [Neptunomonas marina]